MLNYVIYFFCLLTFSSSAWAEDQKIRYVIGEVKILSANEVTSYGDNVVISKREYRPELNQILECALVVDPRRGTRLFKTVALVSGDSFTMSDDTKTYAGTGKLFGTAWNWSAWEFEATLTDGSGTIYAFETFGKDGMTSFKRFIGPTGAVQVVMRETFQNISEPTYGLLFNELNKGTVSCD